MLRASPLVLAISLGLGIVAVPSALARSPSPASQKAGTSIYIVVFNEPAVASFRDDLVAQGRAVSGGRIDLHRPAAQAYRQHLADLRRVRLQEAANRLGRSLQPEFVYDYALNGMAVRLSAEEARLLARVPGIKRVQPQVIEHPLTDRGPIWIKASEIWSGAATGTAKRGEGIIAGIVDTGITATHQSFQAVAPIDGYVHSNPRGSFLGNTSSPKNNKLIGIYDFTTGSEDAEANDGIDLDGHGTHTASTVAGNALNFTAGTYSAQLSGVAPRANLITYKACEEVASCQGAWTLAAINQAVADQVDVINYSIGGGAYDPWSAVGGSVNDDAEAFLAAREAGIVVAAAAGNDGPAAGTLSSPSNAPWVLSVAAATHDRATYNTLVNLAGGSGSVPGGGSLSGAGNNNTGAAVAVSPIVRDTSYPYCASGSSAGSTTPNGSTKPPTWTSTTFAGKIVVCERATNNSVGYARVEMAYNVQHAGGIGMILLNQTSDGLSTVADDYAVPTVHLNADDASAVRNWMASGSGQQGGMGGSQTGANPDFADQLASFSGRGPVVPMGALKPDVTAPGVNIYAAGRTSNTAIAALSGTSMATPHVAGAAALLKSTNSGLSASQIVSSLVLTARDSIVLPSGEPATPHDQGGGMLDLSKAVKAGLYLDVSGSDFRAANEASANGLNLPSLADDSCFNSCSLSRSFKLMPGVSSGQYQVQVEMPEGATLTPSVSSFTLSGANTQSIRFDADVGGLAGQWAYGSVTLHNTAADGRPDLVLPVAIYSDPGNVLSSIAKTVTTERGAFDVDMSGLVALDDARFVATALVAPRTDAPSMSQDPSRDDPYDSFGTGTYVIAGTIPASPDSGAVEYRVKASTSSATAQDVDLFMGIDSNGNGQPDSDEQLCSSTSSDASEDCSLSITTGSTSQRYWVLAQNYAAGGSADTVNVQSSAVALTAATDGSLVASGPGHTALGQAFKVRFGYDAPNLLDGQSRVGYLLLQQSAGSNAAEIPLTLTRSGSGFSPYALANGVARNVSLPAGAAHDLLYFDVPANATSVSFRTASSGNVDLYVARVDNGNASATSTIAAAPARNLANASAVTASGNEVISLSGASLSPGRWYVTPVNSSGATVSATVTATVTASGSPIAFRSGHYFNPSRSGHGAFIDFAGPLGNPDQWVVVWYTYLEDGTPTWYYAQGAAPSGNDLFRADLLRVVWNGGAASATDVGDISLSIRGTESVVFSYNIDGASGSEILSRLGAGGGCPVYNGQSLDVSGHWYSPSLSGFGYSYQVTSGDNPQEIFIPYVYDGSGFPRWVYGQRNFSGASTAIDLNWYRGFCPTCAASALTGTVAGSGTRTLATNDITNMSASLNFSGLLSGTWTQDRAVAQLSQRKQCQ